MHTSREAVLVAQDLFLKMGAEGVDTIQSRAEGARESGDGEAATFWLRVARAMSLMAGAPSTVRAVAQEGSRRSRSQLLSLMQRIEGFRHLAHQAETRAQTTGCQVNAGHFLSIAAGWRQLTEDHERLASAAMGSVKLDPTPNEVVGRTQPHLEVARLELADSR